ncbi:hypothetical protein [Helicobacter sp. MIT 14-3879]|uniref:hypothetical protein n=1 Tax=Helicobacter sp. MIT 14-3879 TaxID=2040649 RepID=UPI000E1F693C|nr:hypothetical protein [Helicobacter sp. MIT 14-3879]RDU64648.1 hypothetical protein CQA44_02745 [Helicobacter sp. MIT 14-3879]
MEDDRYKLVMFGFGVKLRDLDEVKLRLSQIPTQRAKVEGLEQCYLIDLSNAKKFNINYDENGFFVEF